MQSTPKIFLLSVITAFMVACNAQSFSPGSQKSNEETISTADVRSIDNNTNGKEKIVLYMGIHDSWGLKTSSKSDAYYYRVLIEELSNGRYLVQDFFISGDKFTDPYILTEGKLEYTDNEDVAHPNNYYPREGARTVWFESGNKKIESYYKDNMPTGIWIEYFESGQKKSEDTYDNGMLYGTSKSWNEQGDLTSECTYNHGVENGRCYVKYSLYPDTYIYDFKYKDGKKIGVSKSWNIDGSIEEFTFNGSLSLQEIKKDLAEDQFKIYTFDVNANGIDDLVISRINDAKNFFQGNELYVLFGDKSGKYKLSLNTTSFTDDGGFFLGDILPRPNHSGFILSTSFSSKGYPENHYYYTFENNVWYIANATTKGSMPNGEEYYCIDYNKSSVDNYSYTLSASYPTDNELFRNCPLPANKYQVEAEKAEIIDENFDSKSPPNYYIKDDIIETFEQNEDWIKVSYKKGTKFGWIDKRNLSPFTKAE